MLLTGILYPISPFSVCVILTMYVFACLSGSTVCVESITRIFIVDWLQLNVVNDKFLLTSRLLKLLLLHLKSINAVLLLTSRLLMLLV